MQFSRYEDSVDRIASDRIVLERSKASDVRTLKAEQCSPDEARAMREHRLAGDPRARAAQPKLKHFGLVVLIRTLAEMAGRTPNFEHRLWST